jgi:Leucine-rich repeat (LRR) protein
LKEIKGIKHLADLRELKLNDNKILAIPEVLKENVDLEIFDIGNNEIKDVKYIFYFIFKKNLSKKKEKHKLSRISED